MDTKFQFEEKHMVLHILYKSYFYCESTKKKEFHFTQNISLFLNLNVEIFSLFFQTKFCNRKKLYLKFPVKDSFFTWKNKKMREK